MALIEKATKYLNTNDDWNRWVFERIISGVMLDDLVQEYHLDADYQGNPTTCSSAGLFDAYLHFKNGLPFDDDKKKYLSNRTGIIGQYMDGDVLVYITVLDIIEYYDNTDAIETFRMWIDE